MPVLTEEHLNKAVDLFAEGKSRREVAQHLIDTDDELRQLEGTDAKLRNKLSDELRSADPTSKTFAVTKYKNRYELRREVVMSILEAEYQRTLQQAFEHISKEVEGLDDQIAALNGISVTEGGIEIHDVKEFIATEVEKRNAHKQKRDALTQKLEYLEKIRGTQNTGEE